MVLLPLFYTQTCTLFAKRESKKQVYLCIIPGVDERKTVFAYGYPSETETAHLLYVCGEKEGGNLGHMAENSLRSQLKHCSIQDINHPDC